MVISLSYFLEDSLDRIDDMISEYDRKIEECDLEIKDNVWQQAYENETMWEELAHANEDMSQLVDRFESIKQKADMSEEKVKTICSEIKSHDNAKRNIHTAISSLKNLIMLSKWRHLISSYCHWVVEKTLYWAVV